MASGYTCLIGTGATFDEFIMRCARAFGPLVSMRDEPGGAPIPDEILPNERHQQNLDSLAKELAELKAMDEEDIAAAWEKEYDSEVEYYQNRILEENVLKRKYLAMLVEVDKWDPPTEDHVGLKKFMIEQINDAIKCDCGGTHTPPVAEVPGEWYASRLRYVAGMHVHAAKEFEKAKEIAAMQTTWLKALKESVK